MATRRRKASELARDRRKIAALYLRGYKQAEIAEEIGVDISTISRDLATMQDEWRAATLMDLDEAKRRELARVDGLELEYWEAWERSCEEAVKTTTKRIQGAESARDEASVQKEQRLGDPRYLAGVQWCIERRCKLLGLDAPSKSEFTGKDGGPVEHKMIVERVSERRDDGN